MSPTPDAPLRGARAPREALVVPSGELRRGAAIALCAATTLTFEIALTRLLSVVLWYHWAFFAVSVALLGLALPGVVLAVLPPRPRWLEVALGVAVAALPLSVVVVVQGARPAGGAAILVCFAATLPVFLALGTATCLLLLAAPGRRVARIYGADLAGAGLGALGVTPLLSWVPTPAALALLGVLPLLAALLVAPWSWRRLVPGALLLALVVGWGEPLRVRHTKTYVEGEPGLEPVHEIWTPTVRLTVYDHVLFATDGALFAWGPGSARASTAGPGEVWIEQDGSAGTPVTRLVGDPRRLTHLFDDVTAVSYAIRPARSVAVIGAGGGRDVLAALAAGAEQVTAIELHPELVALVRGPYGDYSGHLYDRPDVRVITGDGRAALARRDERFDRVELSLIDSWAATAAGAYTLAENHLYTLEAFRLYWSRLTDDGVLSASRWMRGGFGLELPRLALLARAALVAENVPEPDRHLAILQGAAVGTLLVARSPLRASEIERLRAEAARRGFVVHFPPGEHPGMLAHVLAAGPGVYARHGLRMDPPTDDRPYFFQTVSPWSSLSRAAALDLGVNGEGVWALQRLLFALGLGGLALLALPFFFAARFERGSLARGTAYFALVGLGFLGVELAWLGQASVLLGHPSRAATVVLGSLLLGSGGGALLSARLPLRAAQRGIWLIPAGVVGATSLLGGLRPELPASLATLATVLAVGGAGVGMGIAFPLGLGRFGDGNKAWFWAVNGAASVLASALAVAASMEIGLSRVAWLGAGAYLLAAALVQGRPPRVADAGAA